MRTNEELAILIQQGDKDATAELWEKTREYVANHMKRYYRAASFRGLTVEDLIQEGYFGLLDAVRVFDPQRGTPLMSYLHFYLKSAACKALGYKRKTPIIVWIDQPLPGTEDFTLADTLEDEQAAREMEQVVEDVYHEQLHQCMERCLRTLTPKERGALRTKFYKGLTLKESAMELNLDIYKVFRLTEEARCKLMRPKTSRQLLPFMFYEDPDYYRTDVQDHVEERMKRQELNNRIDELGEIERWLEPDGARVFGITVVGSAPPVPQCADRGRSGGDGGRSAEAV